MVASGPTGDMPLAALGLPIFNCCLILSEEFMPRTECGTAPWLQLPITTYPSRPLVPDGLPGASSLAAF